jgi:hypothetical protein
VVFYYVLLLVTWCAGAQNLPLGFQNGSIVCPWFYTEWPRGPWSKCLSNWGKPLTLKASASRQGRMSWEKTEPPRARLLSSQPASETRNLFAQRRQSPLAYDQGNGGAIGACTTTGEQQPVRRPELDPGSPLCRDSCDPPLKATSELPLAIGCS